MLGAIIGDIVGSIYEFNNIKTKEFDFFSDEMFFTDDTVMTVAIADAIRNAISIGGDSDTLAAITGSIDEAADGIPKDIKEKAFNYLNEPIKELYNK